MILILLFQLIIVIIVIIISNDDDYHQTDKDKEDNHKKVMILIMKIYLNDDNDDDTNADMPFKEGGGAGGLPVLLDGGLAGAHGEALLHECPDVEPVRQPRVHPHHPDPASLETPRQPTSVSTLMGLNGKTDCR